MKVDHPLFYLWIYRKIRKQTHNGIIPYGNVLDVLKRSIPWTPRSLYYPIIKDLEKYGLLRKMGDNGSKKKLDKFVLYEITGSNADSLLNQYNCPI